MSMNGAGVGNLGSYGSKLSVGGGGLVRAGLIRLGTTVAAGSCGESTKVGWTKMGPWAGLVVPDVVGVFDIVPSGFDLMREGGGSAGTVCGCNLLALHVMSLVAGVVVLWGASRVARGSTTLRVVRASPRASPSSSYLGTLLGHPVLNSTSPFFDSMPGLLFDL